MPLSSPWPLIVAMLLLDGIPTGSGRVQPAAPPHQNGRAMTPLPTPDGAAGSRATGFLDALLAPGPAPALAEAARVYDWLSGSWDAIVVDYDRDGTRHESRGEWHFAWVLAGRAMQDVWISPPRAEQEMNGGAGERVRYGTSLRVFDAAAGTWRVAWFNPVNGAENHLVGRRIGDAVVQEGQLADGTRIRWSFVDVRPGSFTWRGELSTDGGRAWRVDAEFFCTRAMPGEAPAGPRTGDPR